LSDPIKLYTFEISHFAEKIRWCLDLTGIPYEEVQWTPFFHIPRALWKSRKRTTVPILESRGEVVQDSTAILGWLEKNRAPFPLIPTEDGARTEVLGVEERLDRAGSLLIRCVYNAALAIPGAVPKLWSLTASPIERRLLPVLFPHIEPRVRRAFKINPEGVARAEKTIAETLSWLDERVSHGGRFLVGDRLTVADITAASLLAPFASPDEHPVYSTPSFQASIASARSRFDAPRVFDWVRDIYRNHRR
jgi:glutathione S-transferase